MTLSEEYKNQNTWRNWPAYLEKIPLVSGDTILDLGCGIGYITKLIANKALQVIGIDSNANFLAEADSINNASNIRYIHEDLRSISQQDLPLADGIWTSFTVPIFLILRLFSNNGWLY